MKLVKDVVKNAQQLLIEGELEQAIEVYLDAIDLYKNKNEELADEIAFQMAYFLMEQKFLTESIEIWKKLQTKGTHLDNIAQIIEDMFIIPTESSFQNIYNYNLEKYRKNIFFSSCCDYSSLPYRFIPTSDGIYYLYHKNDRKIGDRINIPSNNFYTEKDIFNNENSFDTILFDEEWDFETPIILKQQDPKRLICFLTSGKQHLCYLQLPEFSEIFQDSWYIFRHPNDMQEFFHHNKSISLPRKYIGSETNVKTHMNFIRQEHIYRCSKIGRDKDNILLTIGIPSYNRGHRALANIKHLQELPYDSEIEFLVCDNCSTVNTEGYQEIQRLAKSDSRITYYHFPNNPGNNLSAAKAIEQASGKFCCLLSDEDLIQLENVWKYLSIIRKYDNSLSMILGSGVEYYQNNENKFYPKGIQAFDRTFWTLNYISGLMFHTNMFHKLQLYRWWEEYFEINNFVKEYGHNAIAMRLALEGNIYICGEGLFREGESDIQTSYEDVGNGKILRYATAKKRLEQLCGLVMLLNDWKSKLSPKIVKVEYQNAVEKVFFLLFLHGKLIGNVEISFQEAYDRVLRKSLELLSDLEVPISGVEFADFVNTFYIIYTEYCQKQKVLETMHK